jgi:cysteine synthase A
LDTLVPGSELFLKVEGLNAAGSIKLKPALAMVEAAERHGELHSYSQIVESSSGNLGIALAMVAASKGYSFICVVDPNASRQSIGTMRAYGATVVEVTNRDANGGYLGARVERVNSLLQEDPRRIWLNQYSNPANPAAHASTTATQILSAIGRVDYLYVGTGTAGTLMGCVKHFRQYSPKTVIVAVDSIGSVTFGDAAGPRHIPGLGASRPSSLYREGAPDRTSLVSERDAVSMCQKMARQHGVLLGGSTGSVLAAVEMDSHRIPAGSRVATLSPDLGDKYINTIYNDDWVDMKYGPLVSSEAIAGDTVGDGAGKTDQTTHPLQVV